LVALDESLSFVAGAAISCGTGTAYDALRRMKVSGYDTIAIFGQGPVGLSGTQLAAAMGARVIALDISPERLARAKEFGAAETINPSNMDAVAAIRELTHGEGADLTLETSSSPEVSDARNLVQPRGARRRRAVAQGLGHLLLRGRGRQGHDGREPGHAAPAGDGHRVVDLLHARPSGMRSVHRGSPHQGGRLVHR
jgi:D-arabinose 1-dehydrogenase-like Zn-dependent alcohol dehydrogenase